MHRHFHCFVILQLDGMNEKFYVPAVRIEQDIRQDCEGYDQTKSRIRRKRIIKSIIRITGW